MSPIVVKNYIN